MNPASRLLRVCNIAQNMSADRSGRTDSVWKTLVRLPEYPQEKVSMDVINARLVALVRQADVLNDALEEQSVPDEIRAPLVNALKIGFSPSRASEPWGSTKGNFDRWVTESLQWANFVLEKLEAPVDGEAIRHLNDEIAGLKDILRDSGLPPRIRREISDHVATLEEALAIYAFSGIETLKKAVHSVRAEMSEAAEYYYQAYEGNLPDATDTEKTATKAVLSKFGVLFSSAYRTFKQATNAGQAIEYAYGKGIMLLPYVVETTKNL